MLQVDNITVGYSDLPVLKGVSINVAKGVRVHRRTEWGRQNDALQDNLRHFDSMSGSITFEGVDLLSIPPARRRILELRYSGGRQVFHR